LATYDGVRYFDDGLATNVLATTAALEIFAQEPLTLIAGGFDRGVDYAPLARVVAQRQPPTNVITIGPAGQRIAQAMRERGVSVTSVRTLSDAVAQARTSRSGSGVVLFSPAAPSFDQYANWLERSEDFARLAASTE
jgi:UDP-N-acetylmuramoylalanine--D-glutamate ligase